MLRDLYMLKSTCRFSIGKLNAVNKILKVKTINFSMWGQRKENVIFQINCIDKRACEGCVYKHCYLKIMIEVGSFVDMIKL